MQSYSCIRQERVRRFNPQILQLALQAWSAGCHPCRRKTSETVTHLQICEGLVRWWLQLPVICFYHIIFFTFKCINKSLDLDGLVKFPWPWNMYLYTAWWRNMERLPHEMTAPIRTRFGEARPNDSGLLFAVAACRWLQIFYHMGMQ